MDLTLQFLRDYEAVERTLADRAIEVDRLRRRIVELETEAEARIVTRLEGLERNLERLRLRNEQLEREVIDWRRRHEDLAREGVEAEPDTTRLELVRCRNRLFEAQWALGDAKEEIRQLLGRDAVRPPGV